MLSKTNMSCLTELMVSSDHQKPHKSWFDDYSPLHLGIEKGTRASSFATTRCTSWRRDRSQGSLLRQRHGDGSGTLPQA